MLAFGRELDCLKLSGKVVRSCILSSSSWSYEVLWRKTRSYQIDYWQA